MSRILTALWLTFISGAAFPQTADSSVVHTFFLIGDGGEPYVKDNPLGDVLRHRIGRAGKSTVLFLGDNIYPAGLPPEDDPDYDEAELALRTQVAFVQNLNTDAIFIPGNHDWAHWGEKGLAYVINQQQWLDSLHEESITLLPRNGCPGPVEIPINNQVLLVILDTQWFLHQWDKTTDDAVCGPTTTAQAMVMVEDIFRRNRGKRIIVAAHHPLITYGEHGGIFTWKAHIFPLEEILQGWYIPLPVIGSVYPLYRKWLGHLQDTQHPLYEDFSSDLQRIMKNYPGTVYVAGHEHALQYIVKDSTHFIVSGSAAKTEYVKQKDYARYANAVRGFAELAVLQDGSLSLAFIQVDDRHPEGETVFRHRVPAIRRPSLLSDTSGDYPRGQVALDATAWLLATGPPQLSEADSAVIKHEKVIVPVFDIGSEAGGLRVIREVPGTRRLTVLLADASGNEYVLRSMVRYPETVIPETRREAYPDGPRPDSLPYMSLVASRLAEAAGLETTGARLVYVPDDTALGPYREGLGHQLAIYEKRLSDWPGVEVVGGTSQRRMLAGYLFDYIVAGARRPDGSSSMSASQPYFLDSDLFTDHQQTYFVNEEMVERLWSGVFAHRGRGVAPEGPPAVAMLLRGFPDSLFSDLSRQDWIETVTSLQRRLTNAAIDSAVRALPAPVFAFRGNAMVKIIRSRRDALLSAALSVYDVVARKVSVRGSADSETFDVARLKNGDVRVSVFSQGQGRGGGAQVYDRVFLYGETDDIRLYGLGGDDMFKISGTSDRSITIRVIGGDGTERLSDASDVAGWSRKTVLYDRRDGAVVRSTGEVRDVRSSSYTAAASPYGDMLRHKILTPLLYATFNPDDGLFLGGGALLLKPGFRKEPFGQRHLLLANVAPATASYQLTYAGAFTEVIGRSHLELDADVKLPGFANNFFGMGNESVFNDDIAGQPAVDVGKSIDFYRYRFSEIRLQASLLRDLGRWGHLRIGPLFQRVSIEQPDADRFIAGYAFSGGEGAGFGSTNSFGGAAWEYSVGRRNDPLFTQRGSLLSVRGNHLAPLPDKGSVFSTYHGSLSLFASTRQESRLVLASRFGGGISTGRYPFYHAQTLGGTTTVRGLRKDRYYGKARLYGNFELRLSLVEVKSLSFPLQLGVLGFYDVGRIWYKNEMDVDPSSPDGTSRIWHNGWGGGIWFTPFNTSVLSAEVAHSNEGTLAYFRLGFFF